VPEIEQFICPAYTIVIALIMLCWLQLNKDKRITCRNILFNILQMQPPTASDIKKEM
jgi:hypothetical protein